MTSKKVIYTVHKLLVFKTADLHILDMKRFEKNIFWAHESEYQKRKKKKKNSECICRQLKYHQHRTRSEFLYLQIRTESLKSCIPNDSFSLKIFMTFFSFLFIHIEILWPATVWVKLIHFINNISNKRVFEVLSSTKKIIESVWISVRIFYLQK